MGWVWGKRDCFLRFRFLLVCGLFLMIFMEVFYEVEFWGRIEVKVIKIK